MCAIMQFKKGSHYKMEGFRTVENMEETALSGMIIKI